MHRPLLPCALSTVVSLQYIFIYKERVQGWYREDGRRREENRMKSKARSRWASKTVSGVLAGSLELGVLLLVHPARGLGSSSWEGSLELAQLVVEGASYRCPVSGTIRRSEPTEKRTVRLELSTGSWLPGRGPCFEVHDRKVQGSLL